MTFQALRMNGEERLWAHSLQQCIAYLLDHAVGNCTKSSSGWVLLKYLLKLASECVVMPMLLFLGSNGSLSSLLYLWIFVSCFKGGDRKTHHKYPSLHDVCCWKKSSTHDILPGFIIFIDLSLQGLSSDF